LGLSAPTARLEQLIEKYRLIETQQEGLTAADAARASGSRTFDLTARREKRAFLAR
jgi:type III restriction enzyme